MGNGKVAVVTGSSKGIGRAVAIALAKAGYDIGVHYSTSPDKAREVVAQIQQLGVRTCLLCGDTGDPDVPARLVAETVEQLGRLDVMVASAGFTKNERIQNLTQEAMDSTYAVNFRGMILCAQYAARYMVKNQIKGSIIFNTSVRSFNSHSADPVYGGLKAGLNRAIESFAIDLGRYGIRVNGFAPGVTNVSCTDPDLEKVHKFYKDSWKFIPLRRNGYAEDMGGPVVWLASDDSSYVTGQVIRVDGGLSISGAPEHMGDLYDQFDVENVKNEWTDIEKMI